MTRKQLVLENILRSLGVTRRMIGFRYVVDMTEDVERDPDELRLVTKGLYYRTAKRYGTTVGALERAVDCVVRRCWEKGDWELLSEIAGYKLIEKPSSKDFLDILANYIHGVEEE